MDLILWRHAEAFEMREVEDDLARALTPKGERQAQRMAEWLTQRLAHSTRILVSPALRCQQTAKALGKKFKTAPELAPDGNGEAVLKAARWPDASEPMPSVGWCPTIKKGAVWWIRSRNREDGAQVILQAVQSPDCL